MLRAAGLRTIEAGNGRETIALAAEHRPDVILLDLRLPDMDGMEVARRLRGGARTGAIPVVALSASRRTASAVAATAGFAGSLEKPIDVRTFPEQVRSYCRAPHAEAGLTPPTGVPAHRSTARWARLARARPPSIVQESWTDSRHM